MRDGLVVRERLCPGCYFRALKNALADGDTSWARLNNEVQVFRDTLREREAANREGAWRSEPASDKQIAYLASLAGRRGEHLELTDNLTKGEASDLIEELKRAPIRRVCSCCGEEFVMEPDPPNRRYCDSCIKLTPAQRRKLAAPADETVH